jgi:hypothetical protein
MAILLKPGIDYKNIYIEKFGENIAFLLKPVQIFA